VFVDYLALSRQDPALVLEIVKGLKKGAAEAGCAIIGGETAILPEMICGGKKAFDLAGTIVGIVEGEPITGAAMKAGDAIVGLESSGLHSNGYTLARKLLDAKKWGKEMLEPTRIYVKPVLEMLKACSIHGLAHITGGAYSKLSRIGKFADVGFLLDSMPKTKGIMAELEKKVADDFEFYRTFNAGIGMCVVCPKEEAPKVMGIAARYGIGSKLIGKITEGCDVVLQKDGKKVSLL
jgi:phosphoribosylformylglycinamidine cyclo-ligase